MVLDIDSFLNEHSDSSVNNVQNDVKKTREINLIDLEFQKDVEDRLHYQEDKAKNKDIKVLKQLYNEVKNFDEDLLNKFLGIEFEGKETLSKLGNKYSDEFSKVNKNNIKIISKKIEEDLKILETKLKSEEFHQALDIFKDIIQNYNYLPKSHLKERVEVSSVLRKKEIEIYELINVHKINIKNKTKDMLIKKIMSLKKELENKNISGIEILINEIQTIIASIPIIIAPILSDEKIKASKVLLVAENYLLKEYDKIFKHKISMIDKQLEKFHRCYLNKDLNSSLLVYNEILIIFKELPDVFLDQKIDAYKKINKTFGFLNKLMISQNVFMFMETYEYSKKIEAIKEYLWHVSQTKQVNLKKLHSLKEDIQNLPEKYEMEKIELIKYINPLLAQCRNRLELKKKSELYHKNKNEEEKNNTIQKSRTNISTQEDVQQDKKKTEEQKNINMNILKQIDKDYNSFKSINKPEDVKKMYKKLILKIKTAPLSKEQKYNIIQKIHRVLNKKKLA